MNQIVDNSGYQYRGLPLMPQSIESLIVELFSGKIGERQLIANEVLREHLARGGKKSEAQIYVHSVKKALAALKEKGRAENPSLGYWRILEGGDTAAQLESNTTVSTDEREPAALAHSHESSSREPTADVVLGTGPYAVYLYYLPTYQLRSQERGENAWPCKIGRTDHDPLARVMAQAGTALPERPRVAIVVRTALPSAWESALHGILTVRGLRMENSPGAEWFLTCPEDVLAIIKFLDPRVDGGQSEDFGVVNELIQAE